MNKNGSLNPAAIMKLAAGVALVLGLAYRLPLVNMLDTDGMALYAAVYPIYALLWIIGGSGVSIAVSRLVAGRAGQDNYLGAQDVLLGAGACCAVLGVIFTIALSLWGERFAAFLGFEGAGSVFKAGAPLFLIMLLLSVFRGYFKGLQIVVPNYISEIIEQAFKLILGLILAAVMSKDGPEKAALGGMLGITIAEALAFLFMAVMYGMNFMVFQKDIAECGGARNLPFIPIIAKVWMMALPIILGYALTPIMMTIDTFMVTNKLMKMGYSAEVARAGFGLLQGVATPIGTFIFILTAAFMGGITPQITSFRVHKDALHIRLAASSAIKTGLTLSLGLSMLLIALAKPLITLFFGEALYPEEIALAAQMLRVYAFGAPFLALTTVGAGIISGMRRNVLIVIDSCIAIIVKLVLMYVLLSNAKINIMAAPFATVMAFVCAGTLNAFWAFSFCQLDVDIVGHIGKPVLTAVASGGITYLLYVFLLDKFIGGTVACVAGLLTAIVLYAGIGYVLRIYDDDETPYIPYNDIIRSEH